MTPPEQGKDLAEYNVREQTAARLAREARSQADAGASGPSGRNPQPNSQPTVREAVRAHF
jgi:hypothetical protein